MALIKAKGRQTSTAYRESDGADVYVRALRDGTLVTADMFQSLVLEGRVWVVNGGGVAVSPFQCDGAWDGDSADFILDVPVGTTILPITLEVVIGGLTDDEDIEIVFYAANMANTVGASTAITPRNYRNDLGIGSNCKCYVAADDTTSTDVSGASGVYCFARTRWEIGAAPAAGQSEEGQELRFRWSALDDGVAPIVVGAGSITGHVSKTTEATAYVTCVYAELPSAAIT